MKYIIFTLLILICFTSCKKHFDREKWIANDNQESDNPRFNMLEDLKNNYLLTKKTSAKEIKELLGKPYTLVYDATNKETELKYQVGSNPGMNIDTWYLNLIVDSNSLLKNTEIARH